MSNQILCNADEIKAIAADCQGTPTEKLFAILMACGVETTPELMAITGMSERGVQAARRCTRQAQNFTRTTMRQTTAEPHQDAETHHNAAHHNAETHQDAVSHARVEDNNIIPYPKVKITPVESNISASPPKAKQAHGTRLDPAWTLSEDLRQWTRTRYPQTTDERIADELETFHDYWRSVAGQKARKADWDATWRTWTKRAFATAPIRPRAQDHEKPRSRLLAALDAGVA